MQVAKELTEHDALAAHVRDELGITEISQAKPFQAALASGGAFLFGGILPLLVVFIAPFDHLEYYLYGSAILFLALLGGIAAKTGGSNPLKAILRITFWGTIAMGVSDLAGSFFGVRI